MDDLREKIIGDLKQVQGSDAIASKYSGLNLQFNPFPAAAIAQLTHFEPVDDAIKDKIQYFIGQTYKKVDKDDIGDYAGLSIVGEYGYGKTHLMKYIEFLIEKLNESDEIDFKALTVFVDKPDDEPRNIVHKIVEDLEPDNLRRLIWFCIYPKLTEFPETFKAQFFQRSLYSDQPSFFEELFKMPILGNPITFYSVFKSKGGSVAKLIEQSKSILSHDIVEDLSLVDRYIGLIFPDKKAQANWDILSGYVSSKDIQSKEVKFLNSIITILRRNGYNMLYVFIDEFEDLGKLKGAKLTNYITTLNTMINRQRKWSVVVSLTQETLKAIKKESPPLYDRIATFELRLKPLNKQTAQKLVARYLGYAKAADNIPVIFSDELLEEMLKDTEGNFRSFIRLSNRVIEKASEQNFKLPLTADILKALV